MLGSGDALVDKCSEESDDETRLTLLLLSAIGLGALGGGLAGGLLLRHDEGFGVCCWCFWEWRFEVSGVDKDDVRDPSSSGCEGTRQRWCWRASVGGVVVMERLLSLQLPGATTAALTSRRSSCMRAMSVGDDLRSWCEVVVQWWEGCVTGSERVS